MKINQLTSVIMACILGLSLSACIQKTPPLVVNPQPEQQQVINTPNSMDQQTNPSNTTIQQDPVVNNPTTTPTTPAQDPVVTTPTTPAQNPVVTTPTTPAQDPVVTTPPVNTTPSVDPQIANWDGKSDVSETSYTINDL